VLQDSGIGLSCRPAVQRQGAGSSTRHGHAQPRPENRGRLNENEYGAAGRDRYLSLLAKADMGGIPLMIALNLERIAGEHGIEVGGDMTPNDLVRRLRELA
jgi:hypothetical protein